MKIKRIRIWLWDEITSNFKNLRDFEINFENNISVIVWKNWSWKSNILEAIAYIFRNLYLVDSDVPEFDFEIEYILGEKTIKILSNRKDWYKIMQDGNDINELPKAFHWLKPHNKEVLYKFLPESVVCSYSGDSMRMHKIFDKIQYDYSMDLRSWLQIEFPKMFYHDHFQYKLFLVALLSYDFSDFDDNENNIRTFMEKKLNIDLDNFWFINIVLKDPKWSKSSEINNSKNFWWAEGRVKILLDKLRETVSNPPWDHRDAFQIRSFEQLGEIKSSLWYEIDFFSVLNMAYYAWLIEDVELLLVKKWWDRWIIDTELSEWEKQLIILRWLSEFFSWKEWLFLFDEPDNYLHPNRQKEFIPNILDTQSIWTKSHYMITTHSPILVWSSENIDIIWLINSNFKAKILCHTNPDLFENNDQIKPIDVYGNRVEFIYEEVFGLGSTKPASYQKLISEFNELSDKKLNDKEQLSAEEELELAKISDKIQKCVKDDIGDPDQGYINVKNYLLWQNNEKTN